MITNALLAREEQAVHEFAHEVSLLRQVADDGETPGLLRFVDLFAGAVADFGSTELHARQAARYTALGVEPNAVTFHEELVADRNESGLQALASARRQLEEARDDIDRLLDRRGEDLGDTAALADRVRARTRMHLARLEVAPSDAQKLAEALEPCFDLLRSGEPRRLPDFLSRHVDELRRLRRETDRGTRENIPIWKVIAIVIAFGVFLWAFFKCGFFGCSADERAVVAGIGSIATIVAIFC